jgi:hypothetical protein
VELARVTIDTEGTCGQELVLAVPTGQETDTEHTGASRGEQIPDRVADDVTSATGTPRRSWQARKRSGSGLGPEDIATIDHDRLGRYSDRLERGVDLRPAPRCGNAMRNIVLA